MNFVGGKIVLKYSTRYEVSGEVETFDGWIWAVILIPSSFSSAERAPFTHCIHTSAWNDPRDGVDALNKGEKILRLPGIGWHFLSCQGRNLRYAGSLCAVKVLWHTYDNGNERLCFFESWVYLDWISLHYQYFKKESVSCSYYNRHMDSHVCSVGVRWSVFTSNHNDLFIFAHWIP